MRISFSPERRDDALTLEKSMGDRLRINGEMFNFDPLEEGDSIPEVPCEWIVGPVTHDGEHVNVTVILPHGANPTHEQCFPEPIIVTEPGVINVDA